MSTTSISKLKRHPAALASAITAACSGPAVVKDSYYASGGVFHWSVVDASTSTILSEGCGTDRQSSNPAYYAERIRFQSVQGAMLSETVTWEDVTKEDERPPPLDDDAYWCTDAGLTSLRTPRFVPIQECIVTVDLDPAATIQKLDLIDAHPWAHGRALSLLVQHAGVLSLRYRAGCIDMGDAQSLASQSWSELTILP